VCTAAVKAATQPRSAAHLSLPPLCASVAHTERRGARVPLAPPTARPLPRTPRRHTTAQVSQLQPLSVKNPLRSPLLWGTYEVAYCSKPSAVGGPLTKGAGPVLAQGQTARQILQDDGTLINEVSFKTLGLVAGSSRQYGQIKPLSGDTFLVRGAGVWACCGVLGACVSWPPCVHTCIYIHACCACVKRCMCVCVAVCGTCAHMRASSPPPALPPGADTHALSLRTRIAAATAADHHRG
jgi:hypothetical protein